MLKLANLPWKAILTTAAVALGIGGATGHYVTKEPTVINLKVLVDGKEIPYKVTK